MNRAKAMIVVESMLKKNFSYIHKRKRVSISEINLSFQMDYKKYGIQSSIKFEEKWIDILTFISPTVLIVGSDSYWQALQTVNFINWHTKTTGRFYIDTYGDLAYSLRIQYDSLEKDPNIALKEIEAAIDLYVDLFNPIMDVCLGKVSYEDVLKHIDSIYS